MPGFLDIHSKTTKALRALVDQAVRPYGLHPGQDLLLAVLWERDGSTPGEIASRLRVTTPTVVKMATRMAAAGLLTRRRDADDHRLVGLWLTEAGRALQAPIQAERQRLEETVTAGLTDRERRQLMKLLLVVNKSADELLEAPADLGDRSTT